MLRRKHIIALSMVLIFSLLLSGCSQFAPAAAPTSDPLMEQATVNAAINQTVQALSVDQNSTAVVFNQTVQAFSVAQNSTMTAFNQTVQAFSVAQTSTAAAMPVCVNTATPTQQTQPVTTLLPSWTPGINSTVTKTYAPVAPTKTKTPTPAAYGCSLISTSPTSGTKIKLNIDFDGAWKVKNTGSKAWEVGYFDLKYISGTKMQTGGDIFDVSTAVAPGGELTLVVDMKAPGTAGKYTASWALVFQGSTLCTLPVNIEAVNP
jgi:hypothetical protein